MSTEPQSERWAAVYFLTDRKPIIGTIKEVVFAQQVFVEVTIYDTSGNKIGRENIRPAHISRFTELTRAAALILSKLPERTIDDIKREVACAFGISVNEMESDRRPARIALPRQVAMTLCREFTPLGFNAIGERFGGRDHGTVMYAQQQVYAFEKTNAAFAIRVERIRLLFSSLKKAA